MLQGRMRENMGYGGVDGCEKEVEGGGKTEEFFEIRVGERKEMWFVGVVMRLRGGFTVFNEGYIVSGGGGGNG